ncbi:hypothetical protein [Geomonas sp. Red276]
MDAEEYQLIQESLEDFDWTLFGDLEEPKPDYNNSCPFNIHLCSTDDRVAAAVSHLCEEIGYNLDRAVEHMGMVVLNLYKTYLLDPDKWIGYSRGTGNYKLIFRYNRQRISYRPLMKVIDGLIKEGYAKPLSFSFDKVAKQGRCSRIRATAKLIDLLVGQYHFTEDMVHEVEEVEVVLLRDSDKEPMDYVDTEETNGMRLQIERYNDFLQKTYIDLHHDGLVPEKTLYVDLTAKKVRRIFNNESFRQGGRYYGGFWMGLPSELRQRLILNNQKVVECDYSGISVHILYAMEGINYGLKGKDAYTLPDYNDDNKTRNMFKKLLLSVMNASTEKKALKSLQWDINYNKSDYPSNIPNLKQVLSDFRDYHEPIAKYLNADGACIGLETMYHDSQIAERVISTLMDKDIPVLSVHDSFICPTIHYEELYTAMVSAYQYYYANELNCMTDIKGIIKIKYSELTYKSDYLNEPEYSQFYYDPTTINDWALVERLMDYDATGNIPALSQVKLTGATG